VSEAPKSIKVSAFRYQVFFDRAELATAQKESETSCLGAVNHDELRIVVDPKLPHDQQADTLLHEVEHAIFHAVGIHAKDKLTEHDVIERTNTLRLAVLRENPELVAFLMGEVEP
jgi:hypothetical protein